MKTVTVVSQKGGSGKTTLTVNLAIAAALKKMQVVVIDLDPQQSAERWGRLRGGDNPIFVPGHGPNLATLIERARQGGADLVLVDTAPHSERPALEAAKLADIVLIPCKPSSLDLNAVGDTVNIVRLAKHGRALFVLNECRANSPLADQAAEALAEYGLPVARPRLGNRIAFIKAMAVGQGALEYEPNGEAAREVRQLYLHALKQEGM